MTRLALTSHVFECVVKRHPVVVALDHPRVATLYRNRICDECDEDLRASIAAMSDYDLDSAIVADLDELDREYFDNREATK